MASTKLPEQKVILCGEYGVGKSSLFRRFATNVFVTSSDRSSTLGLDHFEKVYKVAGRDLKLQLWDTGGMERVASITSSYYKFAEAAILVFSFDNPDSFNILSQHLLDIVSYAENAKIFLCGNKIDLINQYPTRDRSGGWSIESNCYRYQRVTLCLCPLLTPSCFVLSCQREHLYKRTATENVFMVDRENTELALAAVALLGADHGLPRQLWQQSSPPQTTKCLGEAVPR